MFDRCGCGNVARQLEDGRCSCMCHPANQEHEEARVLQMLTERETSDGRSDRD